MGNSIIRYGLLFGLALAIGFFASYLILGDSPDNYDRGEVVGYTVMLISAIAVIYGIKDFKQLNNGELSFLNGTKVGTGISAIAGLMFGAYMMVYLRWLNPEFTQSYMAYMEQQIKQSGATEAVIAQQLEELQAYSEFMSNDWLQSLVMFVTVFLIGFLITLISSLAMKTGATGSNQTAKN